MKKYINTLLINLILYSFSYYDTYNLRVSPNFKEAPNHIDKHHNDSLPLPDFFKEIVTTNLKRFQSIEEKEYKHFCLVNDISYGDSSNNDKYFTLSILHQLFTCQDATNCSKGEILNIPYQWHWIQPNPRNEIYFKSNTVLLKDTKPPKEFSKYNSFAEIDRTPYLFLSDLVSPDNQYYSSSCDTFSSFGWCSEREMAFVALTKFFNIEGKVVAEFNHSWSEFLIPFKLNTGKIQYFTAKVDNTFNSIQWSHIGLSEISQWKKYFGNTEQRNWYNQKANSTLELSKISSHIVSHKAMTRINKAISKYIDRKLNEH